MRMRIKRIVWAILLSLIFIISPFLVPARAATFNPTLSGSVSTIALGTKPNLTLTLSQPDGDELVDRVNFTIPAGFNVAAGADFAQDATLGTGSFTAIIGGIQTTVPVTIRNDLNLQTHKAFWKFEFGSPPVVTLDSFVDGSQATGHTFSIIRKFLFPVSTPASLTFTINGVIGGTSLLTNPTIGGEYTFSVLATAPSGTVVTKTVTTNFPSPTSSGTNVTNVFNGGLSVTFGKVTGTEGLTTVSSSSNPPPAGTGEFALSGGLYYDFNTTATIKCPCTITIPYDPATTSNPRIYHLESGVWTDVTKSVDTVNHTVTGVVSSFSFFAVGQPNFSVDWNKPIEKLLEKKGNPFPLEADEDLGIKFNLLDSDNLLATPTDVSVEIWQTKDAVGNPVTPTKVLTLTPELNEKRARFKSELDLEKTPLGLGIYQIRVLVSNTTASQSPQVASFTVVPEDDDDDDSGTHISISSED